MAVDVEEQEPKVSTEDLADKLSVKDDPKSEDHIQVEAEEELKVSSSDPSKDVDASQKKQNEKKASEVKEGDAALGQEATGLQQPGPGQEADQPKKPRAHPFAFLTRLFRGAEAKGSGDVEAGTELLSKAEGSAAASPSPDEQTSATVCTQNEEKLKSTDGSKADADAGSKKEKSSSELNVRVQVVPDEKDGKRNGQPGESSTQKMFTSRFSSVRWRWILSGCLLFCIIFILAGFLSAQLLSMPPEEGSNDNNLPLAVTSCGPVLGVKEDDVYIFRGLPYALPPVKDRRWKPPFLPYRLEECWQGTLLAQNYSSRCWQGHRPGELSQPLSEDCLTLNVMTPKLSYQKSLPVVVYMTGSSLMGLDEYDLLWQPSPHLVKEQGVVFVTFNYRLGLFGFMALEVLGKAVYPPTSGNYGLHDQVAVLKWVAKNIRHFGGDPDKVTLLAHSSAATSALALVSSMKTRGLLSGAWLTGGSASFTDKSLQEVEVDNTDFLKNTGCETASCLQEKTAEELMDALPERWGRQTPMELPLADEEHVPAIAVIDGSIVFDQPVNAWSEAGIGGLNIVIGSTAQESSLRPTRKDLPDWTWDDLSNYITEKMDAINATIAPEILDFYVDNSTTPEVQFHTMVSDLRVTCPLQQLAERIPENNGTYVYSYVLTYRPSGVLNGSAASGAAMAWHGLDLVAILGLLDQHLEEMSPLDQVYQSNVQDLFYGFVRNGRPANGNVELMGTGYVNLVSENVVSSPAPYKNCKVWEELRHHKFGRMN